MELWGLTGGIACGKSTVSRLLAQRGAVIIDADVMARAVVEKGSDGLAELVKVFGAGILLPDGTLDRKALGQKVFGDEKARAALNAITHPRIAALSAQKTQDALAQGARVAVYDAPLLIENGLHHGMQEVLVVAASPDTQVARLRQRDGLSEADARARMASQMPVEEKRKVATQVFENQGSLQDLEQQVETFWRRVSPRLAPG
jgi:dephospho-CoA kinase